MKRILYILFFLAINMLISTGTVHADEKGLQTQKTVKDECLLVSKNCPIPNYSLQERIKRLRDEIDRGTAVYTPEELRLLILKLQEARATQDFFNNEAPSLP